jgi:hypothetical protein
MARRNSAIDRAAPQLIAERGVGYVTAAAFYLASSHPGRCHSEAAYARLGGTAPIEVTSGQNQDRHRLCRGGDRQLNPPSTSLPSPGNAAIRSPRATWPAEPAKARPNEKPHDASNASSPAESGASSNTPKSTLTTHRSIAHSRFC